jgi:predicted Zn-dependent peptidase
MARKRPVLSSALSRALLILPLLATAVGVPVSAAEPATETVLPNGMRVVMRQVPGNPVVCSAVLVRAGVAWEPEGMSGASHFLEHLLFNGTETRTQEQLYADVASIGAYNNATTRADHTLYMLLAPSVHLGRALEIQSDMLLRSTLPPDKFEKEKGIVLEELGRDSNDPSYLASRFFTERAYRDSPYARPVLGSVESIRGLEREDVLAYYRDRYVPGNMVLLLAGEFDPEQALALIRRHFDGGTADQNAAAREARLPRPTLAAAAPASVHRQRLDAGRTYVRAAFAAPAPDDPEAPALALLIDLAAAGEGSAVGAALRGGDEPAVYDFSLGYDTTGGVGQVLFSASLTGSASPEDVVRRVVRAVGDAVDGGAISARDLRARREARLTENATLDEQVHYYAMFRAPALLDSSSVELAEESARIESVGIDALGRAAKSFAATPRAIVTVSGPAETAGATGTIEIGAHAAGRDAADSRSRGETTRRETVYLDNGLTLLVHTEPGAQVFAAHLLARNRSAMEPADAPGLADLMHRMLERGTTVRDAESLGQSLRAAGVQVKLYDDPRVPYDDYQSTPAFSFVRVETRRERAEEALALLAEMVQLPRFDAAEIDKTRALMSDLAQRRGESSGSVAGRMFAESIAPDHPLSRPVGGEPGSLEGTDREELVRFHEEYFAPRNLVLTLRGARPHDALVRRAVALFGGSGPAGRWAPPAGAGDAPTPVTRPTSLVSPPGVTEGADRVRAEIGKQQSALRLGAVIEVEERDRPALFAANLVLSDRLQMDLRETQGLAYRVGSGLTELGGGRLMLGVAMGTAPENLELAEAEIRRVTREALEGGIPPEELERLVVERVGRLLMRRLSSVNRAYYDGLDLLFGERTEGNLEFLEALQAVTADEATAALRRYVDPERWVVAIAE